ncbi:hypothetical protein V1478_001748 [Vespula squamosa]|uniref:Uncharacterized protein n=1 Tax=Vespula squamosa TaxID=30214 RepID=A0ABD2BY10_VESSQ
MKILLLRPIRANKSPALIVNLSTLLMLLTMDLEPSPLATLSPNGEKILTPEKVFSSSLVNNLRLKDSPNSLTHYSLLNPKFPRKHPLNLNKLKKRTQEKNSVYHLDEALKKHISTMMRLSSNSNHDSD